MSLVRPKPRPKKPASKKRARGRKRAPTSQPEVAAPVVEPESQPAHETVAAARQRLARLKPQARSAEDHALLVGLGFALAVGQANGPRAAAMIDAVGYEVLPLEGDLPEKPVKALLSDAVEQRITGRRPAAVDDLQRDRFQVFSRRRLQNEFPAVAAWMLPEDRAVVFRASTDTPSTGWLARDACIVVRIRADKATIVGGNLFEALANVDVALPAGP